MYQKWDEHDNDGLREQSVREGERIEKEHFTCRTEIMYNDYRVSLDIKSMFLPTHFEYRTLAEVA